MRKRRISIAEVKLSPKAKKYVNSALNSNRLTYGPFTQKFEKQFSKLHDRKYAIFLNSGTSALQVGLHAMKEKYGWNDGDEVLVPAVTFVSSANVVITNNLKPVFVDVEKDFYGIDPSSIEKHITKKTKAIMPVHLFGLPCDMTAITKIARKHHLKIIEDSCETLFTNFKGRKAGSFGDVGCYSTYVAHIITSGVGGFATTDDNELAITMKSLMFHGRDNIYLNIDDDDKSNSKELFKIVDRRFNFIHVGYNFRLTEMESALGLADLSQWKQIVKNRQKNGQFLTQHLAPFKDILQLPSIRKDSEHCFMLYPIVIKNKTIKRDDLIYFLEKNGIETRPMMPLVNQPVYKKMYGDIEDQYPVAKWINDNGFVIGCHHFLTNDDLTYVVETFKRYFDSVKKLRV